MSGCVVGANAVITKDVQEGRIVAGIPAKNVGLIINIINDNGKYTYNWSSLR